MNTRSHNNRLKLVGLLLLMFMNIFNPSVNDAIKIVMSVNEFDELAVRSTLNRSEDNNSEKIDILDELNELSGGNLAEAHDCPEPLVPFHNRIIRHNNKNTTEATQTTSIIPKILHITHKSRCLPRDLYQHAVRFTEKLPSYSVFFYDDKSVDRLIYSEEWKEIFPDLDRAMKCVLFKGAMVADLWRVLILYKYGGLYSDIDNWPNDIFHENVIPGDVSAFFFNDAWNRPSTRFMAAEARHPIMNLSFQSILSNILKLKNISAPKVVFTTGPHGFLPGYRKFLEPLTLKDPSTDGFKNGVVYRGLDGKTTLKVKLSHLVDTGGSKWKDIVPHPFNSTLKVTRRQRMEIELGSIHWQKHVRYNLNDAKYKVSCESYLENLSNGGEKFEMVRR